MKIQLEYPIICPKCKKRITQLNEFYRCPNCLNNLKSYIPTFRYDLLAFLIIFLFFSLITIFC